jgi:hypothetical protein
MIFVNISRETCQDKKGYQNIIIFPCQEDITFILIAEKNRVKIFFENWGMAPW